MKFMASKLLIIGAIAFAIFSSPALAQTVNGAGGDSNGNSSGNSGGASGGDLGDRNGGAKSAQRVAPVFIRTDYSIGEEKTQDGKKWIVMKADYAASIKADLEKISSILTDYEAMPKVFKNIEKVEVVERLPDGAITRQTTIVRGLGVSFRNTLLFRISNKSLSPNVFVQTFSLSEGDKATLKTEGSWTIEYSKAEGGCVVSYRTENVILHQYPLQDSVMSAFGAGEIKKLLFELCDAIGGK